MLTIRPLGVGVPRLAKFSSISRRELYSLLVAWVVLGISFSVRYIFRSDVSQLDLVLIFLLTLVLVGSGFLGHELAHKFAAERYGCWAEFKLWTYGAMMALLFAIVSQGSLVFAAPGAVYIASRAGYFGERLDRKSNGIVSVMGPLVNIAAALVFSVALFRRGVESLVRSFQHAADRHSGWTEGFLMGQENMGTSHDSTLVSSSLGSLRVPWLILLSKLTIIARRFFHKICSPAHTFHILPRYHCQGSRSP